MSSKVRRPPVEHGADPWWGDDVPASRPALDPAAARAGRRPSSSVGSSRPKAGRLRQVVGLLLTVLLLPITMLRRLLARSPRLRWLATRLAVVLAVVAVLACSVGVILINNVVIGRSAELGELDERRRELRRDNALLAAEAARLSSPDVVFRRATRELGMERTQDVPQFMYLIPGSHALTPWQRQQRADALARKRAAARATATPAPAAGAAPAPAPDPAATSDSGATP